MFKKIQGGTMNLKTAIKRVEKLHNLSIQIDQMRENGIDSKLTERQKEDLMIIYLTDKLNLK
jgi:hypothetical protein